jgi:hypothetical protein
LNLFVLIFELFAAAPAAGTPAKKIQISSDLVIVAPVDQVRGVLVAEDEKLVEDAELEVLGRVDPNVGLSPRPLLLLLLTVVLLLHGGVVGGRLFARGRGLLVGVVFLALVDRDYYHFIVLDAGLEDVVKG